MGLWTTDHSQDQAETHQLQCYQKIKKGEKKHTQVRQKHKSCVCAVVPLLGQIAALCRQ